MRCVAGDAVEECLWLLGEKGAASLATTPPVAPSGGSRAFADGGFYVMRDGWGPSATWALIDGGPHGSLNCGHAHADALSIELAAGGRTILADGGTFSYTGVPREEFRSTSWHNTVTVDDESSSLTGGLFHWRSVARTTTHEWTTTDAYDFWRGSQDGYARLLDPAVHERSVLLLHGRYFVVLDVVAVAKSHRWATHWHCAPDLTLRAAGTADVQVVDPSRDDATLLQLITIGEGRLETGQSWRSEAYGVKREAPSVSYRSTGSGRQNAVTVLVPGTAHGRLLSAGGTGAEVVGPTFQDTVLRRGEAATLEVGGLSTDAACAIVAGRGDGVADRVYLLGASVVEGAGLARVRIAPGALFTARFELGRWVAESPSLRSSGQD
jgi:hypothetical protein